MKMHFKLEWKDEWRPARGVGKDGSGEIGTSLQKDETEAPAEEHKLVPLRTRVKDTHGNREWARQAQEIPGAWWMSLCVIGKLGPPKMQHDSWSGFQQLDCEIYPQREVAYTPPESQYLNANPEGGGHQS